MATTTERNGEVELDEVGRDVSSENSLGGSLSDHHYLFIALNNDGAGAGAVFNVVDTRRFRAFSILILPFPVEKNTVGQSMLKQSFWFGLKNMELGRHHDQGAGHMRLNTNPCAGEQLMLWLSYF
jgi:hypothetical protein